MNNSSCKKPWFRNWFDKNYLKLYQHRDYSDAETQVQLIIHTLNLNKTSSILDLGCGEGRYTYLLNKRGFCVYGLDLSENLIREGKKIYVNLNTIVGDMRAIPGKFNVILSLFTSFGYFEDEKENQKVLNSVSLSLHKDGWFWLDFFNPLFIKKNLVPETVSEVSPGCQVIEKRRISFNRIIKDITFIQKKGKKYYQESVRLYSRIELESMLKEAGIIPMGCFGNYRGDSWSDDQERTIIFGKKQID